VVFKTTAHLVLLRIPPVQAQEKNAVSHVLWLCVVGQTAVLAMVTHSCLSLSGDPPVAQPPGPVVT
jgi:hypothetical protein